jgi:hypothetical protein
MTADMKTHWVERVSSIPRERCFSDFTFSSLLFYNLQRTGNQAKPFIRSTGPVAILPICQVAILIWAVF